MLHKISALLKRCEMSQQRCETLLAQLKEKNDALLAEQASFAQKKIALQKLLSAQHMQGITTKIAMYAQQRYVALLRRQLTDANLHQVTLEKLQIKYKQEKETLIEQRQYWRRKFNKYQYWQMEKRKSGRRIKLRQEELETDERVTWGQ